MTRPLALFLTDFGRPPPVLPGLACFDEGDAGPDLLAGPPLADQLAEARAEGHAAGEAAGRATLSTEVEALQAAQAEALEAMRAGWVAEQGETLAAALREGLAAVEAAVVEALADLLEPVLHADARDRALAELRGALAALLGGADGRLVTVRGAADLVDALRASAPAGAALAFEAVEDAADVAITDRDTTVRSVLGPWAERLRGAMAEGL